GAQPGPRASDPPAPGSGERAVGRLVVAAEPDGERIGPEQVDRLLGRLAPPVTYLDAGAAFGTEPPAAAPAPGAPPPAAPGSYPPPPPPPAHGPAPPAPPTHSTAPPARGTAPPAHAAPPAHSTAPPAHAFAPLAEPPQHESVDEPTPRPGEL